MKRRRIAETPFHMPKISRINCIKHCGWYREFSEGSHFENVRIDHPLYGPVTAKELVQLDVTNHDCTEAANARLRAAFRKRAENAKGRMARTG